MEIRELEESDLNEIINVHLAAFPHSALSLIGRGAVRRYYEWQFHGPHDHQVLGAFERGRLVGFCIGGVSRGAMSGFLERNRWFLASRVLSKPWLLARAAFRKRMYWSVRSMQRRIASPREGGRRRRRSFGILAIAVHPGRQGRGAGSILMHHAEEAARAGGFEAMHLTVHPHNGQALGFYEAAGFKRDGEPSWSGRMIKELE